MVGKSVFTIFFTQRKYLVLVNLSKKKHQSLLYSLNTFSGVTIESHNYLILFSEIEADKTSTEC